MIEGEAAPGPLRPGDWLELPDRVRHRRRVDGPRPADGLARGSHQGMNRGSAAGTLPSERARREPDHGHERGERRQLRHIAQGEKSSLTHQDLPGRLITL